MDAAADQPRSRQDWSRHRPTDRDDPARQAAPEQGFRAALGILRLAKSYGGVRLEAACLRGLGIGASTYGSIASILKNGLDKAFHADVGSTNEPIRHGNIRGSGYYH